MEKIKLLLLLLLSFSCKKEENNKTIYVKTEIIKNDSIQAKKVQLNPITVSELKSFFKNVIDKCKSGEKMIENSLSEEALKLYPNFCELLTVGFTQKEGDVEFDIDNDKGVITINSVEYIIEDGEKHRNEYSTFFYVTKEKERLIIDTIGGAG